MSKAWPSSMLGIGYFRDLALRSNERRFAKRSQFPLALPIALPDADIVTFEGLSLETMQWPSLNRQCGPINRVRAHGGITRVNIQFRSIATFRHS